MGLLGFLSGMFGRTKRANVLAPGRGWTVPVVGEAPYQAAIQSLYRKHGGRGHDLKVSAFGGHDLDDGSTAGFGVKLRMAWPPPPEMIRYLSIPADRWQRFLHPMVPPSRSISRQEGRAIA